MKRYLMIFLIAIVFIAIFYGVEYQDESVTCEDCNIVLISAEPVRADHLGFYGYERNTTPNLDRFAEKSLIFERAFAQAPHTLPSSVSTSTSLYPSQHGIFPGSDYNLSEHLTFSDVLNRNGYYTVASSNVNTGFQRGRKKSFDYFQEPNLSFPRKRNIDEVLDKIESEEKFYLMFQIYAGHDPYVAHPFKYSEMFNGSNTEFRNESLRRWMSGGSPPQNNDQWREFREYYFSKLENNETLRKHAVSEYDGEIRYADYRVGRLLKELDERGMREDTIIVFTAAHGESLGEHDVWRHHTLWNEVIRVPLMINLPGESEQERISHNIELIDIAPTLLDMTGIEDRGFKEQSSGDSLIPEIKGAEKDGEIISQSRVNSQKVIIDSKTDIKYYERGSKTYLFNLTEKLYKENRLENPKLEKELSRRYEEKIKGETPGSSTVWPYVSAN